MTDPLFLSSAGSVELKPCPFCGSKPLLTRVLDAVFAIHCGNQDCDVGCETSAKSPDEAVSAWNSRIGDAAQAGQVPAGYALVPLVPTKEMLEAGTDNNPTQWTEGTDPGFTIDVANDVYVSMIRAAQPPAAPVETEDDDDASYERGFKTGYEVATGQNGPVEITDLMYLKQQSERLSVEDQHALAEFIAPNLGMVLVNEPPHPDCPHERSSAEIDEANLAELTDGHLALDRIGAAREEHGVELAICERINEIAARLRAVPQGAGK